MSIPIYARWVFYRTFETDWSQWFIGFRFCVSVRGYPKTVAVSLHLGPFSIHLVWRFMGRWNPRLGRFVLP